MRVRTSGGIGFSGGLLLSVGALLLLGPGCDGSSPTTPTPPPTTCTYQVTAATQSFGPDASTTAATVTTAASCSWTARVEGGWLSIASGASGTGPGTVNLAIAANANEASREGTLIVADQSVRLTQQGRGACDFTLAPEEFQFGPNGGSRTANLTTGAGCAWTVVVTESWLTVSPMSGSGSATLSLQVAPYTGIPERRADLRVGNESLRVDQDGDLSVCSYSVAPTEFAMHWHHTGGEIQVTTQGGCPWTVTAGESWLDVPSGPGGDGNGTIRFEMSEFFEDGQRKAPVQVRWPTATAGQNVWITQEGCRYGLAPGPTVFPAAGGEGWATVVSQPVSSACQEFTGGCRWTAEATVGWITLLDNAGVDGDKVVYKVLPIPPDWPAPTRVASIRVMSQVLTITQNK